MPKKSIFLALVILLFSVVPVFASRQDDIDDSAADAGANIAKFNLDSVTTFWTAAGCTVLSSGCVTNDGEAILDVGAVDSATNLMASVLTNPPVHTATYVADVLHNTGLAQPAYAQGIGFAGLSPVLTAWKAFRNLSYFLFIVIFVVIGFMIMIRKKISSNAVVTIQEALPKIIVTLLLITFSYAIAGLIVDAMYLSIFVITGLFEQAGILERADLARNVIFGKNIIQIGWTYLIGAREVAGTGAESLGAMIGQVLGGALGTVASGLAYLIIAVAIFIALFRTLIALVTAYVGIILAVIFAPIQLLVNAFPGSDAFGKWLKGIFANAAVFPVAVVMIILGVYLGGSYSPETSNTFGFNQVTNPSGLTSDGFMPPLISDGNWVGGAGMASNSQALIGLGIILLLPEVVKIVKETLQVKEPAYGEAAWKNAQGGWAGAKSVYGQASSSVKQYQGLRAQEATLEEEALQHGQIDYRDPYHKGRTTVGTTPASRGRERLGRFLQNKLGF